MRFYKNILPLLFLLLTACHPQTNPPVDTLGQYDSVYVIADLQWHKQYYPLLERQVFSLDLLSEGLSFDADYHIVGSGCNLYFSDIFLFMTDTVLPDGCYQMDTLANIQTFLPYMQFEGGVTGCYMLDIKENQIQRILGFTAGEFEITTLGEDIRLDISLYLPDSTRYHAIYQGPFNYR